MKNPIISGAIKSLVIVSLYVVFLFMCATAMGQSFERARGYTTSGYVKFPVVHHKTWKQRVMTKIKYNRKRHNNEWFALKESRKRRKI